MRTRHALEQAVHWLYGNDRDLRMPYDRSLNVLLTQPGFEQLLPPHIHQKARLIQKVGNQAVHGNQRVGSGDATRLVRRSEEHTSELQSLMRISYAVFCLKKKK